MEDKKFCKACGVELDADSVFCPKCGSKQENEPKKQEQNPIIVNVQQSNVQQNNGLGVSTCRKWTAFILCLLFGGLGVHRFYVGKGGTGILWLLTCGLFCIGWIVDLIMILTGSFSDKQGRPLSP